VRPDGVVLLSPTLDQDFGLQQRIKDLALRFAGGRASNCWTRSLIWDGGTTFPLIDPSLIGNGQGANTNLVKALRDADGVDGNGQMPFGGNGDGQLATPLQIETIIRWIDAGCPA